MIDFKPIATTDKELLTSFILPSDEQDCDFSFANLCSWHFMTESSYALIEDHLVIRFVTSEGNHEYFMPLGEGSPIPVIEALEACALSENEPLCLRGVQPKIQDKLEQYFPTLFEYTSNRDYFDYIYRRQDLAELKGKHYQPKRNHINRFKNTYPDYEYRELVPELVPECLKLEAEWCKTNNCAEDVALQAERRSMTAALAHFEELGLRGGVLHVNGDIVAFTFGAPINNETFDVCVEKANTDVEGAYTMINNEFALHIPEQYIYINREEDLGLEGLRKAKLSYHPETLLEKCMAKLK